MRFRLQSIALLAALTVVAGPVVAQKDADSGVKASPEQIKAMADWTYTLAVQAATYGAPLVAMYNLRDTVTFGAKPKAKPNEIWRMEDISTPKLAAESGYVSPNLDVVYGFGFADLGAEPIILTAPDSGGRYYMIEICDMWSNAFAYPAGGASGYKRRQIRAGGAGLEGHTTCGCKAYRLAHSMGRAATPGQRQGRGGSGRCPQGPAGRHAAAAVSIQRRRRSTIGFLQLRATQNEARRGHQPHAV